MLGIFLDIEASGLDSCHHRVLDFAFKIVDLASGEELRTYNSIVKQSEKVWMERDPASIEINGFTWEKVLLGKEESMIRDDVIRIFSEVKITRGQAVFICQNPAFDKAFFSQLVGVYTQEQQQWPYHWLDLASMFWVLQIKNAREGKRDFPTETHLSKNAIANYYDLPAEEHPHSALNGVNHLLLCYHRVVGFL